MNNEARSENLRILLTVDPEIPVPPALYGGIERIVDMLVRELHRRGHEIHLCAHPQSTTAATVASYPGGSSVSLKDTLLNAYFVNSYLQKNGPFHIVHSFARLAYLLPILSFRQPKIQSYQRFIAPRTIRWGSALSRGSLIFTTCSIANAAPVRSIGAPLEIIYNGVEIAKYRYSAYVPSTAPLMFLGRVERIKGAHTAIKVARQTGRRLIIAGNHALSGDEAEYFANAIMPHCDGKDITYVGPVNDQQKNELLGTAAALLFPIEIEEPFGIVMVESLACGTPIIGFRRGAVPEVIQQGVTGFICDRVNDMVDAVNNLSQINRWDCRHDAEARFSEKSITDQYEHLYRRAIAEHAH